MVKKLQKTTVKQTATETDNAPSASAVKESAQQIWLAGLGAFAKAHQEGSKVFEGLVKEGLSIQRKTQAVAEERIADATSRMSTMANDITSKATGQWDKLETIFEGRVAKALHKLGVPTAKEVQTLMKRVDELSRQSGKSTTKVVSKKAVVAKKAVTKTANNVVKAAKKRVTAKKS